MVDCRGLFKTEQEANDFIKLTELDYSVSSSKKREYIEKFVKNLDIPQTNPKEEDGTKLVVDQFLEGCHYEKVETTAFYDHKGEPAVVMPKRFRSITAVKDFIHQQSQQAKVYVYNLCEYSFQDGLWYWLRCTIRQK